MVQLTDGPIDVAGLTAGVSRADCGAVVTFLGTVRDLTAGRATVALDYEAHRDMALAEMARIEAEVRQRWPVRELALVHRLGRLDPGEVSVLAAVSCPHRDDAFAACRHVIERLKERVPIWKQEHWADGTSEWIHPGLPGPPACTSGPSP